MVSYNAAFSLSTTESELIAFAEVSREVFFVRQTFHFIQPGQLKRTVTIFEDNDGVIQLVDNPIDTNCSKHIHAQYPFVR